MEGGVKDRYLWCVGKEPSASLNALYVVGVVQWSQAPAFHYLLHYFVVDDGGGGELLPPVHHTMPDGGYLPLVGDHAHIGVKEGLQGDLNCLAVVGDLQLFAYHISIRGDVGVDGAVQPDALHQTSGKADWFVLAHVYELILHRGGAGVDHQYLGHI
ncbi:hypothetical protein ES703_66317 [subsurface metagenome]